ncbi:MAG: hypothetical protein HFJ09_09150 [Lachnospiraceae bacterium]|nr:hypothetical protein [Lachnospiraceae bacterium]
MASSETTSNYKHIADLMHAAIPYVNVNQRARMEMLIKASEFVDSFQFTQSPELSACDISDETVDYEALLQSLQEVCTSKELELVNTMLNFLKTQKIYQTYQSMREFLPAGESSTFTLNKLLPLIENFFEAHQNNSTERIITT